MLHTILNTPAADLSFAVSTQRATELAALTPSPSTAIWLLDLAFEACMVAQVGLLTSAVSTTLVEGVEADLGLLVMSSLESQLRLGLDRHVEAAWVGASLLGAQQLGLTVGLSRGAWVLESCDLWLLAAELAAVS
jgi:hypothetical protein